MFSGYRKVRPILIVVGGLCTFMLSMAETPDMALTRALALIAKREDAAEIGDIRLYNHLEAITNADSGVTISEDVKQFLIMLIENHANDPGIRVAALRGLKWFPSAQDFIKTQCLSDIELENAAAEVLIGWGDWNVSPILIRDEDFEPLAKFFQVRSHPIIINAIQTASPGGRIWAAMILQQYYDDSVTIQQVARELISEYVINSKPFSDSNEVSRALYSSFMVLNEEAKASDIGFMKAGINCPLHAVRSAAYMPLRKLANAGDEVALAVLKETIGGGKYIDVEDMIKLDFPKLRGSK